MSDKTKMLLIIMIPSFIAGFVWGFFDIQDFRIWLAITLITTIIIVFSYKKLISKSYKNDEINKKLSIMSDAIAARVGLILMILVLVADYFNFSITEKIGLEKEIYIIWIVLVFMFIGSMIANIYYSRNPDKLP